ncbi:hypothetical protein SAMN05444722_2916 [Rhodovulum sp. ES.010]|uniref:dihydrodipicolinate reductase n=1 Tax=Rhodovulum sp. ES.010 TaxID=1882821 RepID=UPI0009258599|nr:dihydrodipicolinate reductase [Rhodovulum sp. ES.010]SIO51258.1 hypothetical protein SAMN05444722_2916 [Rhodovulum sp. ES.010]
MSRTVLGAAALAVLCAAPVSAEGFRPVESRATFVSLVHGKDLRRMGVKLAVTPRGQVVGQAFGKRVSGDWRWDGKYFCPDLTYGDRAIGPDCQAVQVRGTTVRFITDRGAGRLAVLRLE